MKGFKNVKQTSFKASLFMAVITISSNGCRGLAYERTLFMSALGIRITRSVPLQSYYEPRYTTSV